MSEDEEPTFLPLTAEQAERVGDVLKLPPPARKLIRLGCVEQQTLDEIAATLDLTAAQVIGLRDDLAADLERAAEAQPEEENLRRVLLSFFRGSGGRDHPPHSALNVYTGEPEEVTVRSPILNEADLNTQRCRECRHWDGPEWPSPHPGLCRRGVSEFLNPYHLTLDDTYVYVRNGVVYGCETVTTPEFTCPFWQGKDDWRTEPADLLGRSVGQAGRWRQKAPGRR